MPRYEFLYEKCRRSFEQIMTISEREKSGVRCPKCKGTEVAPLVQRLHGADIEEELMVVSAGRRQFDDLVVGAARWLCSDRTDPGTPPGARRVRREMRGATTVRARWGPS